MRKKHSELPFNPPWVKPGAGWWCMVVIREIVCTTVGEDSSVTHPVDDIVAVYGPYSKSEAQLRVDVFNRCHQEADDGAPIYRPVINAPAFLNQDDWCEHYATARPMNDFEW